MNLTFDYYHNLEQVELRLCNPDGRELYPLPGRNRHLTLRFNDLSELTFDVDSKATLSNGDFIDLEVYDYIQTKRLVFATNIGWFQISNVEEHDNGVIKYKSVTAESYQSVLKHKGFLSEERVYCFYNPNDPYDNNYDSARDDSIPSVLGQWHKQLGIGQDLSQGLDEPKQPYDYWTVTYINSRLIYGNDGACRTFKENTTYGYDWIVNDVEKAFEVLVLFDFMNKTICVVTPQEVTQKANIIYTFSNFMKNVKIKENAEDIVTVLNCNGDNCDITSVNPTGTNYICDFSYYMDKDGKWMSPALITKLEEWRQACENKQDSYDTFISELQTCYTAQTRRKESLQTASLRLQDLKTAQSQRSIVGDGDAGDRCGIVCVERMRKGTTSMLYNEGFIGGHMRVHAYQTSPSYDAPTKRWIFNGPSISDTVDNIVINNLSGVYGDATSYWYFEDMNDSQNYCKLLSATAIDSDTGQAVYSCDGYDRYTVYCYPAILPNGETTYTDRLQQWINVYESFVSDLNLEINALQTRIDTAYMALQEITSSLNLIAYFANYPVLLRELNSYWIEGDYTNESFAVLDTTTPEERIALSKGLIESGRVELSKVCQPRFSFSLESANVIGQYEFHRQMSALELGKIITIEKDEGVWYYPALLEISLDLDRNDSFSMTFANATRLDDWGYTYADLIAQTSSTSRKVSANWQNMTAYAKERETIASIIKNPLDTTLRAASANMVNQDFSVDQNGILGRKRASQSGTHMEYEKEQVRLINNLLLFTDDNWETAKTALGKVYYTDSEGRQVTSYGLVAETIIGALVMGEKLNIRNENSTVSIGANGIEIAKINDKGKREVVFKATSDGELSVGTLFNGAEFDEKVQKAVRAFLRVDGTAIEMGVVKQTLDEYLNAFTDMKAHLDMTAEEINAKVSRTGGENSSFGWSLTTNGFYLYSNDSPVMKVTKDGLVLQGQITADSGKIGGWNISGWKMYSGGVGDVKTAVVQAATASAEWVFAAGGASHNYYADCPFRVRKDGSLYASKGQIGDWILGDKKSDGGISCTRGVQIATELGTARWSQAVALKPSGLAVTMTYVSGNPRPTIESITKEIPWYRLAGITL